MNWKYLIGKSLAELERGVLGLKLNFVVKNYPYGRNWIIDAKKILKVEPKVIIDAGANVGSVSKQLNFWFPSSKIMAFEPILNTFNTLCTHIRHLPNILPFQLALGANAEKITISINKENTINSIKVNDEGDNFIGKEEINIVRLADILTEHQIAHIDILKIDVEGFEFEVLEGCGDYMDRIDLIVLEVGYEREVTKVHFSDVEIFMEKHGFILCGIYEATRNLFDKRKLWYSNNLYIKKQLLSS